MAEPPKGNLVPRIAVSLALAAALGWMLARGGLPVVPTGRALAGVAPWAIPGYAAVLLAVHAFRATRWRHQLRAVADVQLRTVLATAWIGFAAVMFLPLRAGEVVRPVLVARRSAVPGWQAAGTVGAERIIDGVCLSAILFVALRLAPPRPGLADGSALDEAMTLVPSVASSALVLFCACLAAMILFLGRPAWGSRAVRAAVGWLSPRLSERLASIVERIAQGLSFLPSPRRLVPYALETGAYWACNAAGLWLLARGCGLALDPWQACVVMGCLGFGIVVPSGPGFFGAFQLAIYLALGLYLPREVVTVEGSAFVFIAYVGQLALHGLGALTGALMDR